MIEFLCGLVSGAVLMSKGKDWTLALEMARLRRMLVRVISEKHGYEDKLNEISKLKRNP